VRATTIYIAQRLGTGICVTAQDGQIIYKLLHAAIESGDRIQLSFSGVTRMTTAFLNAAVGQLYGEFPIDKVRSQMLPPIDAEPWQLSRLKLVVDRAKQYFENREKIDQLSRRILGSE
jgi:STAS-like domain of unknown function (DUF4325)